MGKKAEMAILNIQEAEFLIRGTAPYVQSKFGWRIPVFVRLEAIRRIKAADKGVPRQA